jgi:hypothetical protein
MIRNVEELLNHLRAGAELTWLTGWCLDTGDECYEVPDKLVEYLHQDGKIRWVVDNGTPVQRWELV